MNPLYYREQIREKGFGFTFCHERYEKEEMGSRPERLRSGKYGGIKCQS